MKKNGLALLILSSLSVTSYAKDFVTIIQKEESNYESGSNYIVEYGEWILTSSTCSVDKEESEIYFGKTFNQTETCNDEFERTITTKITDKDGVEKVISEEKENKTELNNTKTNLITGTHLEKSCNDIIVKGYETTDGIYKVGETTDNFDVYCDMRITSGWTLVAKVNTSNTININEPQRFFIDGLNENDTLNANMTLNNGLSAIGMDKVSKLNLSGLSNLKVIQQFEEKSVDFYKEVNLNNLNTWFISSEQTATKNCIDEDMTLNCGTTSFTYAQTYNFTGLTLTKHGFSATGDLHFRLNNNDSPSYSSLCSYTFDYDNNAWGDTSSTHWGNGLLIFLK